MGGLFGKTMDSESFVKKKPTTLFFSCAVPAVALSAFGALYSAVDGFFVGRYLGEAALAAVSILMPPTMIVAAVANMIATGASVNASMLLGAGEREEASRIFSFSILLIIALSSAAGVIGFFFAEILVFCLAPNANQEALYQAALYLRTYAVFCPLVPVYFALDNFLRVCGKQNLSAVIGIVSQLLNVALTFVLIAVLHLGVGAAAFASCASIAVCSVYMLLLFRQKRMDLYYVWGKVELRRYLRIMANGTSGLFGSISASITSIVLNLLLLEYGGVSAVAAFSVIMYVDGVVGMIGFGLSGALQPAISHCHGAGLDERVRAIFRRVLIAVIATGIVSFLVMFFAGPSIAALFIKAGDDALLKMSAEGIAIFSFSYLVGWVDLCFSSYFTALDQPARSLAISVCGSLVFPLLARFALTPAFGLTGIWLSWPVAELASCTLSLVLYATMKQSQKDRTVS